MPVEAAFTADQFPALLPATPATHVLDRVAFTALFERCRGAADRGVTLPIPTAVRLDLEADVCVATATAWRPGRFPLAAPDPRPSWRRRAPSPRSFIICVLLDIPGLDEPVVDA